MPVARAERAYNLGAGPEAVCFYLPGRKASNWGMHSTPRQHRESKGIERRSMSRLSLAFASGHVCLFGQITQKREKCWRLPNKKSHGRQEFESGRRRSCSRCRTNNGAHRQSPAQEHGWFRHDQVRLEILSAKWSGIEVRKYECGIARIGQWWRIACFVM